MLIRAALRRTPFLREAHTSVYKLDGIEINLGRRKLVVDGKDIRLTPKEFDLLHYLMAHAGVPIAHKKLLNAIWGVEYGQELEYLRTFMYQLRKKIEDDPASPQYLFTEAWLGYRFRA